MNLFRRMESAAPQLTPALIALLEHCDRTLLQELLSHVGLNGDALDDAEFHESGEIRDPSGRVRLRLVATGPGDGDGDGAADAGGITTLLISPTGRAPEGGVGLSWEQFDRWLARRVDRYDPDSRTGFLLRQFRAYLPEVGITYFTGFDAAELALLPEAHRQLEQFYRDAAELFARLPAVLPTGLTELRSARPEDLLAGFFYCDYAGSPLGSYNFLRIALQVGTAELQLSCWFAPESDAHRRVWAALQAGGEDDPLRAIEPPPLLRLWSAADEQRLPLREYDPSLATDTDWDSYTVAIQTSYPFGELGGAGLVERIGGWVASLIDPLRQVLGGVVH